MSHLHSRYLRIAAAAACLYQEVVRRAHGVERHQQLAVGSRGHARPREAHADVLELRDYLWTERKEAPILGSF